LTGKVNNESGAKKIDKKLAGFFFLKKNKIKLTFEYIRLTCRKINSMVSLKKIIKVVQ